VRGEKKEKEGEKEEVGEFVANTNLATF